MLKKQSLQITKLKKSKVNHSGIVKLIISKDYEKTKFNGILLGLEGYDTVVPFIESIFKHLGYKDITPVGFKLDQVRLSKKALEEFKKEFAVEIQHFRIFSSLIKWLDAQEDNNAGL